MSKLRKIAKTAIRITLLGCRSFQIGLKFHEKLTKNLPKIYWKINPIFDQFFDRFLLDFGSQNRAQIDQKSIKKSIKKLLKFWYHFFTMFDRFWLPQASPKSQTTQNNMQKTYQKKGCKQEVEMRGSAEWRGPVEA